MICGNTARPNASSSANVNNVSPDRPMPAMGSGVARLRRWLITSLMLALAGSASAQEMKPPRITAAPVDWRAAVGTLGFIANTDADAAKAPALAKLNAALAKRFTGAATSPVPVLLPFDTDTLLRELAAGSAAESNERYLSGFHARAFFHAGPSGYDAALAMRASDVPELADIK